MYWKLLFIISDKLGVRSNKQIRDQFLIRAKNRGLSAITIYRYRRWIRKFLEFHQGIALEHAELEEVDAFLESLSHLSESTRRQAKNALDVIFKEVLKKNLNVSLDRPKKTHYFTSFKRWISKRC